MCITDSHNLTLAVKVALNPNNQPNFESHLFSCLQMLSIWTSPKFCHLLEGKLLAASYCKCFAPHILCSLILICATSKAIQCHIGSHELNPLPDDRISAISKFIALILKMTTLPVILDQTTKF